MHDKGLAFLRGLLFSSHRTHLKPMPIKRLFILWFVVFAAAGITVAGFAMFGWPAMALVLAAALGARIYMGKL